jgi:histidinol-phosphatase (PHP family)
LTQPPDYHIHTCFSCDSETSMAEACEAAIAREMQEIAFTDHVDFEPWDECYGYLRPGAYVAEIERCRRRYGHALTIRAGVEIGEAHTYPDQVKAFLETHDFDFVLGSVHWVGNHPTWTGDYFNGQELEEGLESYFGEVARLAAEADYDVLAHFDIVRRATYKAFGLKTPDYTPHEHTIRRALRTLVERGKGLEINTSPRRRGMGPSNPTLQVLRWYREVGGEVLTIGSDAHNADSVGACFDEALDTARAAGFKRLATFERREVRWMNI